jgi:Asp-tRNA(Asn)/Glu-tRNA(Gln) amidotransferase A subunit family amidase
VGATASSLEDLCFTPAIELAARIRRRELSPVELMNAVLARIERLQPQLNAYTVVYSEPRSQRHAVRRAR